MLFGSSYVAHAVFTQNHFGFSAMYDFVYDDVACSGSESFFGQCPHTTNSNCVKGKEEAGVRCGLPT